MKEVIGDLWDYYEKGNWIAITTNGVVRNDGSNPMGKGIALQAKQRFPRLPFQIGEQIKAKGRRRVFVFPEYRIITFPVKFHWRDKADMELIENSAIQLKQLRITPVYLVRAGCGAGQLAWSKVKPVLEKYLDDNFIVVERN